MNLSEALKIIENAPKNELVCMRLNGIAAGCGNCPIVPFKGKDYPSCHDSNNNFKLLEIIRAKIRKEKLEKLLS